MLFVFVFGVLGLVHGDHDAVVVWLFCGRKVLLV